MAALGINAAPHAPLLLRLLLQFARPTSVQVSLHRWVALTACPGFGYMLWGRPYFTDWHVFAGGTLLLVVLAFASTLISAGITGWTYRNFPGPEQARQRLALTSMGLVLMGVTFTVGQLGMLDAYHVLGYHYDPRSGPWILGLAVVFDLLLAGSFELAFAFQQWQTHQLGAEQLEQQHLQRQLTAMKQQVNPHFLFNSLSSLSVLIGEDPQEAERFVDELARVYRYLLQAHRAAADGHAGGSGREELVPVEGELRFLHSYAYLLRTRYGAGLHVELPPPGTFAPGRTLLVLSLQTLVDNAIRHNALSAARPLRIVVAPAPDGGGLRVGNNVQPRTQRLALGREGLGELQARYQLLGSAYGLRIEASEAAFSVTVPLVPG